MLAGTATAQINKGYKGMVNAGWILLSEDVSFEALTIHGYQFNPHLLSEVVPESTIILRDLTMQDTYPFSQTFAVTF